MNDKLSLIGNVIIERRARNGEVLDREELHNLVVGVGKERIAKMINKISAVGFDYIGIGEGSASPAIGDTELETEVTRELASLSYEASYKAVFEKTFTFSSGESYSITEAGVLDGSGSGATLFDRFTFSAKAVDADTDLYIKIIITVA